jgi:starch phosphorylase
LRQLAYNLHWDWNVDTKDLFRRLDRDLWESSRHNPVLMLGTISQSRLQEVAEDEGFIAQMERAAQQLEDYHHRLTWYHKNRKLSTGAKVTNSEEDSEGLPHGYHSLPTNQNECYAYFSMEFGLTDCLPIYSGGLGVLAGDHLKSASDLGLPLVGVGLLYQEGYFSQFLNADGWQNEHYPINDFYNMPLHLERHPDGSEIHIEVEYPGRKVYARIWRVQVGTVPLYLLDTNIDANASKYDHDITDRLYGGDIDMRIHQEMMLGIGGVRALTALGLNPTAFHKNEGHSAFLSLERIRVLIQEQGLSFAQAKQVIAASSIFTTHTPVPAGIDLFSPDKILYYLGYYAEIFGLQKEEFLALGRENTGELNTPFSMAILAIKMASFVNGVAKLHGAVSRAMFGTLWPSLPLEEVPITSITNGVHARSCVSPVMQSLYDRYLGPRWERASSSDPLWDKVTAIPDEELWRYHERCRAEMIVFARERLVKKLRERSASVDQISQAAEVLDPSVLTIGFARRFATYKRATLWMRDLERIKRIMLANKSRRLQFVIAGKAHPQDIPGKELIKTINHIIGEENLNRNVVFIPDYDLNVARHMIAGCDVWLNTPRRPREASGTSGMKAAMNGLLNLSVLDGWWDEADYVRTGWPIGHGEDYEDPNYQDEVEANALYDCIEKEVIPLFYNRDAEGTPRGWVSKMKNAIRINCPYFNTARMVREYASRAYFPASDRYFTMTSENYEPAKELADWKNKMFDQWYNMKIESVDVSEGEQVQINQTVHVKARINLAGISSDHVRVELYTGLLNANGDIVNGTPTEMDYQGADSQVISIYTGNITYTSSGLQGMSLRVLPKHEYLSNPYDLGLILWAQ